MIMPNSFAIKPQASLLFFFFDFLGIGIGLLCSFLVEMRLYKKYGKKEESNETKE